MKISNGKIYCQARSLNPTLGSTLKGSQQRNQLGKLRSDWEFGIRLVNLICHLHTFNELVTFLHWKLLLIAHLLLVHRLDVLLKRIIEKLYLYSFFSNIINEFTRCLSHTAPYNFIKNSIQVSLLNTQSNKIP